MPAEPPYSEIAAAVAGAKSTTGRNPYTGELAGSAEAEAWQAAYEARIRAGTIRLLHDRVAMFEDVIARAEADRDESLVEIDRLERFAELTRTPAEGQGESR